MDCKNTLLCVYPVVLKCQLFYILSELKSERLYIDISLAVILLQRLPGG